MVSNAQVAEALSEVADLLDLLGERFKPEAYRRAARSVEALPEGLDTIAARGELETIPGVGEAISGKVGELLRTGALAYLERLRAQVPPGVLELMRLPGVGPKTARRFWVELQIDGPPELVRAIAAGRLEGVKGFAEKKIGQLRAAAEAAGAGATPTRAPIEEVWPLARAIVTALRAVPSVQEVAVAGSFRRARETVGDLDVLVTADESERVFDAFSRLPEVGEVRLRGPTKETVILRGGLQVDLRVVEPGSFGAALQYFTGSKDHNVRLRSLARERGLKVNEYGVYRGDERLAGRTEQEVYAALGLAWIPPELREDRGEIAAATEGKLPRLVEATDLVADLHVHLSEAPEVDEVERLVRAARARSIRAVGVVVGSVVDGRTRWTAPEAAREALGREMGEVRIMPVVEVEGAADGAAARSAASLGAEYLILVPTPATPERPAPVAPAPRLLAHLGGPAERLGPALELARTVGAAVEVGPGPGRLDSNAARSALETGVPLSVPVGLTEPDDRPTGAVALGFARRAGATRERVVNGAEPKAPGPGGSPPAGGGRRSRRPSPRRG